MLMIQPIYALDVTLRFPTSQEMAMSRLLRFQCTLTLGLKRIFSADELSLHHFEPLNQQASAAITGLVIEATIVAASSCFPCLHSLDVLHRHVQVLFSTLCDESNLYFDFFAVDLLTPPYIRCCS